MRSCDICHRVRRQAVVRGRVGAACCDNGRVRDPSSDRGTGLVGFRRYTWWSLTGTTAFVLVVLLGRRILTAALPVWAAVACVVALAVTTVASVVLLSRRADRRGRRPARPPTRCMAACRQRRRGRAGWNPAAARGRRDMVGGPSDDGGGHRHVPAATAPLAAAGRRGRAGRDRRPGVRIGRWRRVAGGDAAAGAAGHHRRHHAGHPVGLGGGSAPGAGTPAVRGAGR
jgi:hypothetical protein